MAESDEKALREQLANATRMMVMADLMDYSGHLSARVPGTDRVLIQPRDSSRAFLRPEEILVVDVSGKLIEGEIPPPAEVVIHLGIYRAREDVFAIAHAHPPYSIMFTMAEQPLVAMRHYGYRFVNMPTHMDTTHIRTDQQGAEMAETLGKGRYMMLRSHGSVVVGDTIPQIFLDSLEMEENAKSAVQAAALGKLKPITTEEAKILGPSFDANTYRTKKIWGHYMEKAKLAGIALS
ncbi:MAG: ribulose-5-phosphate 4-epimerase-like epimerase or aldolase [Hyphomicrobiales bacterium]|nr:ribulose-5-phosphate 4-epimerase-like epimerase or aldolase [Hyphomicrobiales bacterium]